MNEIESDPGDNGEIPPSSFLLNPEAITYREILELAKTNNFGTYMEHATYPFLGEGKDAPFLHRTISVSGFEFHFRSRDDIGTEKPYVIDYRGRRPTKK